MNPFEVIAGMLGNIDQSLGKEVQLMRGTANLADREDESKEPNEEQPWFAGRSDNNPGGNDRAHNEPNNQCPKKLHAHRSYQCCLLMQAFKLQTGFVTVVPGQCGLIRFKA